MVGVAVGLEDGDPGGAVDDDAGAVGPVDFVGALDGVGVALGVGASVTLVGRLVGDGSVLLPGAAVLDCFAPGELVGVVVGDTSGSPEGVWVWCAVAAAGASSPPPWFSTRTPTTATAASAATPPATIATRRPRGPRRNAAEAGPEAA